MYEKKMTEKLIAIKYKYNPKDAFSVDWYIGKRCNFDCSYCPEDIHDNDSPHLHWKNMKKFVDKLDNNKGKNIIYSLTGGEPTLNPSLIKLCQYLKRNLKVPEVTVTTNGSMPKNYYLELFENVDQIVFSLHFEYALSMQEQLIESIIALEKYRLEWNKKYELGNTEIGFKRKKTLLVRFIVLPGQLSNIKNFVAKLQGEIEKVEFRDIRSPRLSLISQERKDILKKRYERKTPSHEYVKQIFQLEKSQQKDVQDRGAVGRDIYSYEEREFFKKILGKPKKKMVGLYKKGSKICQRDVYYQDLIFNKKNNFSKWYCRAGLSSIKIAPNGDMYRGSCHQGGKIGNLYSSQDNFELPKNLIICDRPFCTDIIDLRQKKASKREFLGLLD